MKKFLLTCVLFFISIASGYAQVRIAILPIHAIGIDESARLTSESLLQMELQRLTDDKVFVVQQAADEQECYTEECALEIGKELGAAQVILCRLSSLGEKIIVQYVHLNVSTGSTLFADNTTAKTIEDLDTVMKRVAESIIYRKPISETLKVGNITQQESVTPMRRRAHKSGGFSFGYLYPTHGYDDIDRAFTFDFRTSFDSEKWSTGMLFAVREGFATNVYAHYLTKQTDVCPYFGGAFGFHWVAHEEENDRVYNFDTHEYEESDKNTDGFELTFSGGVRFFRTYNFQIIANWDYIISINDYDDKAIVFTLGILK